MTATTDLGISNAIGMGKSQYRPEIDGLRAFAIVAVIINHFNRGLLPSGYLGVDIFFVISGYVITSSLSARKSKNFVDFAAGFYARRVKRLMPALVAFVLITSVLICLFNPDPKIALTTGKRSLLGISNIYLNWSSTDYFAQSIELNPFTHTWSLGVEEQFYLLFPFLIWFSGFGQQTATGARNLLFWVGAMTIASLMGFIYLNQVNQTAAYFLMPPRFWEMAAGCLLFIGFQRRARIEQALERVPPLLVVAAMVGVMFLPVSAALPATIGIVVLSAILIACLKRGTPAYTFFTLEKVVYIGLISYSLYLWHWTVLSISRWTIGVHWWSVPIQIVLMVLMAVGSYKWIEKPIRIRVITSYATIIAAGIALLATTATFLLIASRLFAGSLYTGNYPYQYLMTKSRDYPNNSSYTGRHCHLDADANDYPKDCWIRGKTAKTMYFVGNSHSDHYRETQFLLNKELGVSIDGVTVSSCVFPPALIEVKKCGLVQKKQRDRVIAAIKRRDIVVVSNRYSFKDDRSDGWMKSKLSVKSLNDFAEVVIRKGGKVVLFGPLPEFSIESELCKKEWFRPLIDAQCEVSINSLEAARSRSVPLSKLIDKRILVYSPLDAICSNGKCRLVDDANKPIFVDTGHLTDYANRKYIYPSFKKFLFLNQLL
jgi:peptidoglycan/LPS O-acetylase OafA/YrhL